MQISVSYLTKVAKIKIYLLTHIYGRAIEVAYLYSHFIFKAIKINLKTNTKTNCAHIEYLNLRARMRCIRGYIIAPINKIYILDYHICICKKIQTAFTPTLR